MKSVKIKKGDIAVLAVLALILAAALLLRGSGKNVTAQVLINGEEVYSFELDKIAEKREIELENGVVIGVEPGKIYFVSSFCKGKDCVSFGELSKAGQTAVCVPAKTVITIKGVPEDGSPDAISY